MPMNGEHASEMMGRRTSPSSQYKASFAANAIIVSRLARRRKTTAPDASNRRGCKHPCQDRRQEQRFSFPFLLLKMPASVHRRKEGRAIPVAEDAVRSFLFNRK
jgi:hypothetical protein